MTFYQIISTIGIPCIYGTFKNDQPVPYLSYTGAGQDVFSADNGYYRRVNLYQIVYYYSKKDETKEDAIETTLLANGFTYEKSGDYYDSSENVYYIIYGNIKSLQRGR